MCVGYADEDAVLTVGIRTRDGSREEGYRIRICDIDPANATEMEMFALCCYWKDLGICSDDAYRRLLDYAEYCGQKAEGLSEFTEHRQDYRALLSGERAEAMERKYQISFAWREMFLELFEEQIRSKEPKEGGADSHIIEKADE